jgi:YHS domain-containing protein
MMLRRKGTKAPQKGQAMKCKYEDTIPVLVSEWQQDVLCPACDHYFRGRCVYPNRRLPQAGCPFDGKELPLRRVQLADPGQPVANASPRTTSPTPSQPTQEDHSMTSTDALVSRIDQEIEAEVGRQKEVWVEMEQANRERGLRLQRYEVVAQHVVELLKPRVAALTDRFQALVKGELLVRAATRTLRLNFASTVANVALRFEMSPDRDVSRVRLECSQEIIPVVIQGDKPSVLELPLDGVRDDAVVSWFDDRIVGFVKTYIALVRQDTDLREQLKDQFVEDPVTGIRFPKYLASSTLERDGRTFYFVDADTRREFEKQPTAQAK